MPAAAGQDRPAIRLEHVVSRTSPGKGPGPLDAAGCHLGGEPVVIEHPFYGVGDLLGGIGFY